MGLKDLFRMTEMEKLTLAFDKYINQEPNPQSSFVTSFENQVGIDEDQVGIEDQYTLKDIQKMKLAVKRSEDIYSLHILLCVKKSKRRIALLKQQHKKSWNCKRFCMKIQNE